MRKVFYSFHYDPDCSRVQQIRNMGVVDDTEPVKKNAWEEVRLQKDQEIQRWINKHIESCSCTVVLVGTETSERDWVKYEIERTWEENKGLLGIYIHGLKNLEGKTAPKGDNPFSLKVYGRTLEDRGVECHEPPRGYSSQEIYAWIKENIEDFVEDAIKNRERYS